MHWLPQMGLPKPMRPKSGQKTGWSDERYINIPKKKPGKEMPALWYWCKQSRHLSGMV
ncbi:hypothetical protein PHLCEN_2v5084 [Hermanssonia centrifuga]|uniref:Uncharacterized protein n=1 Tax=Hermanssonia centrifuga TaxID=98765 RepID=A0A2R6PC35_9APHY|nr:hypothetical protein PHLCEN_2v5084 [Hermanssonia centrifuga]